jgi:ankyrin repeat protein
MVKSLLAARADPFVCDVEGRTLLHLCTGNKTTKCLAQIVKAQLALGPANIDAIDQWGMTALHWAAHWGSDAIVKIFIQKLAARMVGCFMDPSLTSLTLTPSPSLSLTHSLTHSFVDGSGL